MNEEPRVVLLVCGGRNYTARDLVFWALDSLMEPLKLPPETHVVHGAAKGADTLAGEWAVKNKYPVTQFPARWDLGGKKAGMQRNRRMLKFLQEYATHALVLAFPGGVGTDSMCRLAYNAGVTVWRFNNKEWVNYE